MHTILRNMKNVSSVFFIGSTFLLAIIAIISVWAELSENIFTKSALSIGLLFVVSLAVIIASRYMYSDEELRASGNPSEFEESSLSIFAALRKSTIVILIVSSTILGLIGVLAIWDFIESDKIIGKILATLGIIIFSSLVTILVCIIRARKDVFSGTPTQATVASELSTPIPPIPQKRDGFKVVMWVLAVLFGVPFIISFISALVDSL